MQNNAKMNNLTITKMKLIKNRQKEIFSKYQKQKHSKMSENEQFEIRKMKNNQK